MGGEIQCHAQTFTNDEWGIRDTNRRRQAMGGRQDEVIKQHEGNVMMQKDVEAAREEVARMAKEAGKASQREEELKEEVEKLRQGMHQILESVREQVNLLDQH